MSELDKIILGGQKLNFIDRTARSLASGAQNTANTANSVAQSAQQTANTANSVAQSAQQTANTANSVAQSAQQTANTANSVAQSAQQTANTANSVAQSAQQTANTANSVAQSAQQTANSIITGFNTQFEQRIGEYVSPYFCLRNSTVYVEFPNIGPNKVINHGVWNTVCYVKTAHKPLSTIYRDITVGGTITVLVEISTNGEMKMYSPTNDIPLNGKFFGGFSYLTIN